MKSLSEKSNDISKPNETAQKTFIRKYRHVAAVHLTTRPSTLSHETEASASFVGFRNLMVIVLGMTTVNYQVPAFS
jgi:diacylglycerol O-acyltransferase-1